MQQLRTVETLKGSSPRARDGEIGSILEVYFDDEHWTVRYFVVRTGGWLRGRDVLIAPRLVIGVEDDGHVRVDVTREQVQNSPPISAERPVSRHYEAEYYRYYGWNPYWPIASSFGVPVTPLPAPDRNEDPPQTPEHPHLHASDEVRGYRVHARDGEFGEVEDLVVDDRDWQIRYLVFDTRRWLPGKKVLLAPTWIDDIDWVNRQIVVDLDSETIRSAPPYEPSRLITRDYEVQLYGHYGHRIAEPQ